MPGALNRSPRRDGPHRPDGEPGADDDRAGVAALAGLEGV